MAANRRVGKDSFTFWVHDSRMKTLLVLISLPLASCGWSDNLIAAAAVGVNVASVATIQRTPGDAVYSWWTGRDCSAVRLDQGKTWCRPVEPPPAPPVFCSRGLGVVDCWQDPDTVPGRPRGVADGPAALTEAQEADRVRQWPW